LSRSGVLGNATAATPANGQVLVETLVAGALEDIEAVRNAPLPAIKAPAAAPPPRAAAPRPSGPSDDEVLASGCTAGEERAISLIGMQFTANWKELDARKIAAMFMPRGDMRHPDGTIERGREV